MAEISSSPGQVSHAEDPGSADTPDAISKLVVEGFKSLANRTEIEIRPLTLLAGANSSGKSSAMQPLLLLKQTLEAPFDPGPLLLDGPNVKFTSQSQLFSSFQFSGSEEFSILITLTEKTEIRATFEQANDSGPILKRFRFREKEPGLDQTDYLYEERHVFDLKPGMSQETLKKALPKHMQRQAEMRSQGQDSEEPILRLHQNRFFLTPEYSRSLPREFMSRSWGSVDFALQTVSQKIEESLHVPGLRDNPSRTYKTTAVGNRFPGTFDTYVASVIHAWQREDDERLPRLADQLQYLGLTGNVAAERVNDTQVELQVAQQPIGASEERMINVADVGIGVSQVLPVLVAMLAAEPGQLVYVEQPEIHLHPRAQALLADPIVEAANRGVRVVVETHSQLLLLAIQTRIAEDKIDPEDVMLHWFSRDPKTGITDVDSVQPDEKGAFGEWPEDFSEVELEWQDKYLDAAEKHLFGS